MKEEEYFENTLQELYDKYPSVPVRHKTFLRSVLKYGSGNKIKNLSNDSKEYINKDTAASYIKEIVAITGIDRRYPKQAHRLYILEELLGIKEFEWLARKDELVNRNVIYEHENAEKPSSAQVVEFLASQEKSVLQQIVQLLPKLSEKEWSVIETYRRAIL